MKSPELIYEICWFDEPVRANITQMANHITVELEEIKNKLFCELSFFEILDIQPTEVSDYHEYNSWTLKVRNKMHGGRSMIDEYLYNSYYKHEECHILKSVKKKLSSIFSSPREYANIYDSDLKWVTKDDLPHDTDFNSKILKITDIIKWSIRMTIGRYEEAINFIDERLIKYSDYDSKDVKIKDLEIRVSDLEDKVESLREAMERSGILEK